MPYVGAENVPGRGLGQLDTATNNPGDSYGLQAVMAYLKSKNAMPTADNIRQAVMANARAPGDPSAAGSNLGPVVLNLRNAGIEDAAPMPSARRGGGNTSALPTPPIPPQQDTSPQPPDSSPGVGYVPPAMPPPVVQAQPPGGDIPPGDYPGPPRSGGPVTNPVNPQLPPPPAGAAAIPGGPGGLGALIAGGLPLLQYLRGGSAAPGLTPRALPGPTPQLALPAPEGRPALPAPEPRLALPAPEARPALPAPPTPLALPAPPAEPSGPGFSPEYPISESPAKAAIDRAVPADAPVAPRARARARGGRIRLRGGA